MMAKLQLFCIAVLLVLQPTGSYKVAIIGGGVGGTAVAFFLKHGGNVSGESREDIKIDIFDKSADGSVKCGRLATATIQDQVYEAGGAVLHQRNRLAKQLVKHLALEAADKGTYDSSKGQPRMVLVNGSDHLLETSSYSLVSAYRMFMRYGFDLLTLQRNVNRLMDGFERVYTAHDNGTSFGSLEELLEYQGLYHLTQTSTREYLQQELGLSPLLVDELVSGVTRVNYNQEPSMMALAGMVGLAGNSKDLWRIKGGNEQLCKVMQTAAAVAEVKPYAVVGVQSAKSKSGPTDFRLVLHDDEENEEVSDRYDAVVVAAPMPKAFTLPNGAATVPTLAYQTTVSTLVHGQPKAGVFGYDDPCDLPEVVLTVKRSEEFLSSFGRLSSTAPADSEPCPGVFKVFSRKALTKSQLQSLFSTFDKPHAFKWAAYPKYPSSMTMAPFQLLPGLYYANAIETAASSVEMALVAARNAALLAIKHLSRQTSPVPAVKTVKDDGIQDQPHDTEEVVEQDHDGDEDSTNDMAHEEL